MGEGRKNILPCYSFKMQKSKQIVVLGKQYSLKEDEEKNVKCSVLAFIPTYQSRTQKVGKQHFNVLIYGKLYQIYPEILLSDFCLIHTCFPTMCIHRRIGCHPRIYYC